MQLCLCKIGPGLSNLIASATIIIRGEVIANNAHAITTSAKRLIWSGAPCSRRRRENCGCRILRIRGSTSRFGGCGELRVVNVRTSSDQMLDEYRQMCHSFLV